MWKGPHHILKDRPERFLFQFQIGFRKKYQGKRMGKELMYFELIG